MKNFKRLIQFLFCSIASVTSLFVLIVILKKLGYEGIDIIDNYSIISIGLGIGWALFQILFVKINKIKENGRLSYSDWIIVTIQTSIILLGTLFFFHWITGQ